MSNYKMWEPVFKDSWYKIDTEVYKFTLERAIIRYEDLMSEDELITTRVMNLYKVVFLLASLFAGIGTAIKFVNIPLCIITIIIYIISIFIIMKIIRGREVYKRGSSPNTMLVKDLEYDEFGKLETNQLKLVYYNEVCRVQDAITYTKAGLKKRRRLYFAAVVFTTISIISTVILITNMFVSVT